METLIANADEKMKKTLERFQHDISVIRTGRANPSLLENVRLEVYGQMTPLAGVATINAVDAKTLTVNVWDANNTNAVDKAIRTSDLNLNPRIEGNKLFIVLPDLSTERRQEFVKMVKKKAEDAKISIRNIRRDANEEAKKKEKEKEITEDDLKNLLDNIQKETDKFAAEIEKASEKKQIELTSI